MIKISTKILVDRRIERAFRFINDYNEFFIGLGRTTEWDDRYNPPELTGEETDVEELFGYIKSEINIDPLDATTIINDGVIDGEIEIIVDGNGKEGNNYTIEVIDTSGIASLSLNVYLSGTYDLKIELSTDSNGDLDSTQNIASNIVNKINNLTDFSASYSGDGTGVLSSAESDNFTGGVGPTENYCFVVPDSNGSILYRDSHYRKVYDKDAYDERVTMLYFEIIVPVNEFTNYNSYRQAGLYCDLTRADGVTSDILTISEVSDNGTLYSISNFQVVERRSDRFEKVMFIIDF